MADGGSKPRTAAMNASPDNTLDIQSLGLSVQAFNCLRRAGLASIGQVLAREPQELLGIRNFGIRRYRELRAALLSQGYPDIGQIGPNPELAPEDHDDFGPDGSAGSRIPRRPLPGSPSVTMAIAPEPDPGHE